MWTSAARPTAGLAFPTVTTEPSPEPTDPEPTTAPAGRRCFGDGDPRYAAYHDDEWGVPVRGEAELLERFCLEAFQSGLSWLTVLRKRPAFRAAFAGFDPRAVARFTDDDVARLLADPGIIRNRAKIEA
ncbi:MAG: DNA-3-methyladenine glycosylase I, partial [Actinomycetales bacterium]|nr:DNA-3-methyladenine glycosylase I [Actinomycetales bacterium]